LKVKVPGLGFIGLIAKIVFFCAAAAMIVVGVISYLSYVSLEESLEWVRHTNGESRVELARLESQVESARTRIDELLEKERGLRDETEKLKEEALELERDWGVVKEYKHRIEQAGREIEELRQRIRALGR
jgi:chromosome segregation ATPase